MLPRTGAARPAPLDMLVARPFVFPCGRLSTGVSTRLFSKNSVAAFYDVVIVGGGPAGLALAAAIGMPLVCIEIRLSCIL